MAARTPLWPRLFSLLYEAVVLAGLLIAAGLPFILLTHYHGQPELRLAYRLYLLSVVSVYFCYFWHRSGQTVAMRAWRLRLVDPRTGAPPSLPRCLLRLLLAAPGTFTGLSLLWALIDREGQFLHDRLLGLRLEREPKPQA